MHSLYPLLNPGISDQDSRQKFEAAIQEVVGFANDIQRTKASTAYIHILLLAFLIRTPDRSLRRLSRSWLGLPMTFRGLGHAQLISTLNPGIADQDSRQKFEAAIQEVVGYANDIQRTQACTAYINI